MHGKGLALGTLVSIVSVAFFAWNADWQAIAAAFSDVEVGYVLVASLCTLLSLVGRAWRWRVLLPPGSGTSFRHRLTTTAVGFMGNCIFPGRIGEPLRCYMLSKLEPRVSFTSALASIVIERLFDILATLIALTLFLGLAPKLTGMSTRGEALLQGIRSVAWVSAAGLCAVAIVLFLVARRPRGGTPLGGGLGRIGSLSLARKVQELVASFRSGLASLRSLRALSLSLVFTGMTWVAILLNDFYMLRAFGLDALGIVHALGLMVVLCFAVALPQAPGYVGVFQIASEATLTGLYGVETAHAKGFAIALWASQVFPVIGAGVVALWLEGLSLADVRKVESAPVRTVPNEP